MHPKVGERGAEPQSTAATNALTVQAKELVAHFFKRFHNVETSYPTSKAINQAISLITQYGIDQARHIVDFAHTVAQESNYKPQTFGGILQYTSRALADYEHAKQRSQTAAREREERRRLRAEEELTRQYEDYRGQEIDRLRASQTFLKTRFQQLLDCHPGAHIEEHFFLHREGSLGHGRRVHQRLQDLV